MYKWVLLAGVVATAGASSASAQPVYHGQLLPAPQLKAEFGDVWSIATRGRLEMDAVHIGDDNVNHRGGIYDRRTRFGLNIGYGTQWKATAEIDFSDDSAVEYTDLALRYHNGQDTRWIFGHFKEPFGMERIQSSQDALFNERAAIDTFTPKRNLGVQFTRYNERASLSLATFIDSLQTNINKDKWALTARATYAKPLGGGLLHSGVSGSWREMERAGFSAKPNTAATDISTLSTGRLSTADGMRQGGLELAYGWKNLLFSSEYIATQVTRDASPDVLFDGYYVQGAWTLTGENYRYSTAKNAVFQPVAPAHPFSLKRGTWGAFELGARYQGISLNDKDIQGGVSHAVTGGINWYPNTAWRVSADATYTTTDAEAVSPHDDPVTIGMRVRVAF